VHRFKVTSPLCRSLNGYTPAGFEQVIIGLAKPAERRELPPLMDPPDQITIDKVFNNYWCAEARDGWALSRLGIRCVPGCVRSPGQSPLCPDSDQVAARQRNDAMCQQRS
jgi:hypothetical protein